MASSIYVVSAMAGNFWQESNLNPGLWEGARVGTWTELKHGYGLGQWTNTNGDTHGRLYQVHEWLVNNGYAIDDGNAQCEYVVYEGTWYRRSEYSEFTSLQSFLDSDSTDLERLTHAWNLCWEGIHDSSWDKRVDYADECMKHIIEHANDPSITDWITGNRYLSPSEIKHNAVMLWRYFGSDQPIPPTPTKKKKMPVWMMIRRFY